MVTEGRKTLYGYAGVDTGLHEACLPCRVEQMLEKLKMGWVFQKPAAPADDSQDGLNTISRLLGEPVRLFVLKVSLSWSHPNTIRPLLWRAFVTVLLMSDLSQVLSFPW